MQNQVPILQLGDMLIVTIKPDLTDDEAVRLKDDILQQIKKNNIYGVILDISVVDLIDSYMGRILSEISEMSRLMGAKTVITGMSPYVAISMVEFGLNFRSIQTALTVEKGMEWLSISRTMGVSHG
ncbi:STAS domain-containing protein [Xylanibacillus composti]|uniref:Anti-sigma factor B antagonist n=1 Tax=Xylanibacillus composti TaxID=1572762 RepID=A0A8J4H8Y7_9BACL|nr:STAS domain-containing protein [Xylanibacillus composti]MDT9724653.1 STAS domain-containing protein [Xylanibacillus composti]GIQ70938.1 anti-sigma factor B antagonist [Xylanibacillus composti]